jgi:hypothetical protein
LSLIAELSERIYRAAAENRFRPVSFLLEGLCRLHFDEHSFVAESGRRLTSLIYDVFRSVLDESEKL